MTIKDDIVLLDNGKERRSFLAISFERQHKHSKENPVL